MSVREVQTAAARVFHVDRVSDSAIQELKSRFRYHPLDIEALFSIPVEPSFSTYGDYGFMTLLWPEATTQDSTELRFFVAKQQLTIVGDTVDKRVATLVAALHDQLGSPESQMTAPELVHQLLQRLCQTWTETAAGVTTVAQTRLTANAQVVRQLGRWLQTSRLESSIPQLIIDAHALDSLADRPVLAPAALSAMSSRPNGRSADPSQNLPSVLRTYAVASAVMVILVIVTLAVQ